MSIPYIKYIRNNQPSSAERDLLLDEAVAGLQVSSDEAGQLGPFLKIFSQLLKADLEGQPTGELRDAAYVYIEQRILSDEWKWAAEFFIRSAVDGDRYDEEMTLERNAKVLWIYKAFADYVNAHQDLIDKPFLGWAYWNYERQFFDNVKVDDGYLIHLVDTIDSDSLLTGFRSSDRFDADYYRLLMGQEYHSMADRWEKLVEGAEYGELPEWIEFICSYAQDTSWGMMLCRLFEKLKYPLLQATLSFHVSSSRMAVDMMAHFDNPLLALTFLEAWSHNKIRYGATLSLYLTDKGGVRPELMDEGKEAYRRWEGCLQDSTDKTLFKFADKFGWKIAFQWYFSGYHQRSNGLVSREIQEKVDGAIEWHLKQVFQPSMLSAEDSNALLLQFVCKECLDKFGDSIDEWQTLRSAIEGLFYDVHERPLPKYSEESMHLWRGYAYSFAKTSSDLMADVANKLSDVRTYFEGYVAASDSRVELDMMYQESFVLSSLMLVVELDDIDEELRHTVFCLVAARLSEQLFATTNESERAPYLVSLQFALLVSSQVVKSQYDHIVHETIYCLSNLYEVRQALWNRSIGEEAKTMLLHRWEQEQEVINIRSHQIDKGKRYKELKEWIEEIKK